TAKMLPLWQTWPPSKKLQVKKREVLLCPLWAEEPTTEQFSPEQHEFCDPICTPSYIRLDKQPFIKVFIGGRWVKGLVDTGADEVVLKNIHWDRIKGYPGTPIKQIGVNGVNVAKRKTHVEWRFKDKTGIIDVLFSDTPVNLFGRSLLRSIVTCFTLLVHTEKIEPLPVKVRGPGPKVPQWPLTKEKYQALKEIVKDLLAEGKISEAAWDNPYNTPVFVIKKKGTGRWRMLMDFRELNKITVKGQEFSTGLPYPPGIKECEHLTAIDIKDAYFTIPLHEDFRPFTAFSVVPVNREGPIERFQWNVLPQGWVCSPAIYQTTTQKIIENIKKSHPDVMLYQYMDDLLIGSNRDDHKQIVQEIRDKLGSYGFKTPDEKVQEERVKWIGFELTPKKWRFQPRQLKIKNPLTVNELQQLVGNCVWVQPEVKIPLYPLTDLLRDKTNLQEKIQLTPEAIKCVEEFNLKLKDPEWKDRIREGAELVIKIQMVPRGIVFDLLQDGNPIWGGVKGLNYDHSNKIKKILRTMNELNRTVVIMTGREASFLLPGSSEDWEAALQKEESLTQIFPVKFYRHSCRWTSICGPVRENLTTYYTDGGKKGKTAAAVYWCEGRTKSKVFPGTNQQAELKAICMALLDGPPKMNIITDSRYAYEGMREEPETWAREGIWLEIAKILPFKQYVGVGWVPAHKGIGGNTEADEGVKKALEQMAPCSPPEAILLKPGEKQNLETGIYMQGLRPQSFLPRADLPVAITGTMVDSELQLQLLNIGTEHIRIQKDEVFMTCFLENIPSATEDHERWHTSPDILVRQFHLPKRIAKEIVARCQECKRTTTSPVRGTNPRGRFLWQMDNTHWNKTIIWVAVETNSGLVEAQVIPEETALQVALCILQLIQRYTVLHLHSDNGPCFTAHRIENLCKYLGITKTTGIPYNPQSQGVVERAHRDLKDRLAAYQGDCETVEAALSLALVSLNKKRGGIGGHTPYEIYLESEHTKYQDQLEQQFSKQKIEKWCYVRNRRKEWKGPYKVLWDGDGAAVIEEEGKTALYPHRHMRFIPPPDSDIQDGSS
ncbi:reverse transcriptase, partial [Bovine immunodeficiency virus]|uniref:reverse transcriptase n=1 Tax=Bovine immunodeficiency virus TaxID=11657 RepID=UPI0000131EC9